MGLIGLYHMEKQYLIFGRAVNVGASEIKRPR